MRVSLSQIAHARGGDKGDVADISLFAYRRDIYELLCRELSSELVAAHYEGLVLGPVQRYTLHNLLALKFVMHQALDGGASLSLRSDNLGKSLAAGLLRMEIEVPDSMRIEC